MYRNRHDPPRICSVLRPVSIFHSSTTTTTTYSILLLERRATLSTIRHPTRPARRERSASFCTFAFAAHVTQHTHAHSYKRHVHTHTDMHANLPIRLTRSRRIGADSPRAIHDYPVTALFALPARRAIRRTTPRENARRYHQGYHRGLNVPADHVPARGIHSKKRVKLRVIYIKYIN